MNSLLSGMQNVSKPMAGVVAVLSVTSLLGLLKMFGGTAFAVLLAGLVFVGLLLLAYRQILKLLAKRKAAPMARELSSAAGTAPQGVSDPARRARLDDLRKNFENGVEKFRAAGKNLYALPWYLLVGEPGSGKTEAIRHCNVGFPPGLQDQLQGAGGTINMNWWFTNHAVILDTAGRLMFEEVEPGTTSEWQEFLKLLRKFRPNCPVNGMLLVIPAESLIRDTADSIERKGGKIAQQLDQIQRALGVRFPVFVVITKCDLINGFREFFDDLKDPQLQHQILGWSNPAPLDEAFNPELIDKHLETVQKRLVRRRLGLMLDPVHTEDPTARRTDQVDALFAFPEALTKIAPRLRRYLEMIFVAGAWSAKPLFLRGIYFTSSMREGSALDADLAEALGMPVESLPEGRVWERDRAYFLRDLFMHKIFREKGLVTRAVNTRAQQRQRRAMVLGTAAVGALLVTVFTAVGFMGLKRDVVEPKQFWEQVRGVYVAKADENFRDPDTRDYYLPILSRQLAQDEHFHYEGASPHPFEDFVEVAAELRRIVRFPEWLQQNAEKDLPLPWVFYPVAAVTGNWSGDLLRSERRDAARVLIEGSVIRPLVDAVATRLEKDAGKGHWSPQASEALVQIVRLEAARRGGRGRGAGPAVLVEPLLAYATMGNDSMKGHNARDIVALQEVVHWLYAPDQVGAAMPSPAVAALTDVATGGIETFARSWKQGGPTPMGLSAVERLIKAFKDFENAEGELLAINRRFGEDDYPGATGQWRTHLEALRDAAMRIDQDFAALGARSLDVAYREELEKYRQAAKSAHQRLLDELEAGKPVEGARPADSRLAPLQALHNRVQSSLDGIMTDDPAAAALRSELARLDALMVARLGTTPAYKARFDAYALVDAQIGRDDVGQGVALGQFRERVERIAADISSVESTNARSLVALSGTAPEAALVNPKVQEARSLCSSMLSLAGRQRRMVLVERFLAEAPTTVERLTERVAGIARERDLRVERLGIPLTVGESRTEFLPEFHPAAAAAVLLDGAMVSAALGTSADAATVLRAEELRRQFGPVQTALDEYRSRYVRYWSDEQLRDLQVVEIRWQEMGNRLNQVTQGLIFNRGLLQVAAAMRDAARQVEGAVARPDLDRLRQMADLAERTARAEEGSTAFDRVLNSWKELGRFEDVLNARQKLLQSVDRGDFALNYALFEDRAAASGGGDFVLRFWEDLTYKSLRSLAQAAEAEARSAFSTLRTTSGFPLRKLRADLQTMDVATVLSARTSVETVLGGGGGGQRGVRPTGSDRFNQEIERLRGLDLLDPQERRWLVRMQEVLAGLPRDAGDHIPCRITVLADRRPERGDVELEHRFPDLDIVQGAAAPRPRIRIRGAASEATSLRHPGDPVRIYFFTGPDAVQPAMHVTLDGPWAPIRLLHEHSGRPTADRKVWEVEMIVRVTGEDVRRSLWLKLEFERPLPPLEDWPD